VGAEKSRPESAPRSDPTNRFPTYLIPGLISGVFLLIGLIFTPLAGIQTDEALFASPLFTPSAGPFRIRVFHYDIPLMVMTYIGTLKTLLYWPVFALFGANAWSLRIPAILLGAGSVFAFYLLVKKVLGSQPAFWGALLLATDPVFLLTTTFDWGPVAMEHFLLVLSCFLFARFHTEPTRPGFLRGAAFCLGLALWNKAIFLWALGGLGVATAMVFPREVRANLSSRNLRILASFFLLGCLPFVLYNLRSRSATLRENAHLELASIPGKFQHLQLAANGTSLFGYLVSEEYEGPEKIPATPLGKASVALRNLVGEKRETYFFYGLGALLLAVPWWWKSRAARFSAIFVAVAWLAMASTHDAGGAAHHVILLWPFPILFAVAALRWRGLLVISVAMNLLVLNQYFAQFQTHGPAAVFSDAIYPLSEHLKNTTGPIYHTDWGYYDSLILLHKGKLQIRSLSDDIAAEIPTPAQQRALENMLADPQATVVAHAADRDIYPQQNKKLTAIEQRSGYTRGQVRTITDSNGRPVFEVFRYQRR
jgi:4-amino-4-deoxy-L-arabinose transferase-like glycosyltransferase